jgi:predicted GIY-YIG superfamily endonuclease
MSYDDSVIYGIYNEDTSELLYIGSSINFQKRVAQHTRQCKQPNAQSQFVHRYIFNNNIQFVIRLIEKCFCKTKEELEDRECQIIQELKPWYNIKREKPLRTICVTCNRIFQLGQQCRICETVKEQTSKQSYVKLSLAKTGCQLCGCVQDCKGLCDKCFSETHIERQGCVTRADYLDNCCPFEIVYIGPKISELLSNQSEYLVERSRLHNCDEICDREKESIYQLYGFFTDKIVLATSVYD